MSLCFFLTPLQAPVMAIALSSGAGFAVPAEEITISAIIKNETTVDKIRTPWFLPELIILNLSLAK